MSKMKNLQKAQEHTTEKLSNFAYQTWNQMSEMDYRMRVPEWDRV
jgi:hypothetical protein